MNNLLTQNDALIKKYENNFKNKIFKDHLLLDENTYDLNDS